MRQEFFYPSADGKTQIHGIEWIPEGEVKAVLQMCHGMVEHIERYHEFAQFLAKQGYYVVGHDHLGHGLSVTGKDKLGFFCEEEGNGCVIADIHSLRKRTESIYPDVPYFMLGHSMGSFLVRQYLGLYSEGIRGVIIMGTGMQPDAILAAGKFVCKMIAVFKGWHHRSKLVDGMAVGAYDKAFQHVTDGSSWLSRNASVVKKYKEDPGCGFRFTVNAYYNMFHGMSQMNQQEKGGKLPTDTAVFFVAGKEDPVGNSGASVEKAYQLYMNGGVKDVQIKLYEEDRHEILNELDKEAVYADLLAWLENHK